jgi:MFS family permease
MAGAAVLGITAVAFLLGTSDPQLKKGRVPKVTIGEFARSFWISPKEHPDFAWVWVTRFMVMLGVAFVNTYLLFFSQDVLGFSPSDAEGAVFQLQAVLFLSLLVSAVISGPLSDKVGKVKIFVIGAGVICGTAMVVLMFTRELPLALGVALALGIGFGAYTALDLALISRVLPNAEDRAKDLGVVNIANALPQVMAPALAGLIIASLKQPGADGFDFAYSVLYGFAAVITITGALLVTRIKSVP